MQQCWTCGTLTIHASDDTRLYTWPSCLAMLAQWHSGCQVWMRLLSWMSASAPVIPLLSYHQRRRNGFLAQDQLSQSYPRKWPSREVVSSNSTNRINSAWAAHEKGPPAHWSSPTAPTGATRPELPMKKGPAAHLSSPTAAQEQIRLAFGGQNCMVDFFL